jgi:NAD(P)H-flavin reductase
VSRTQAPLGRRRAAVTARAEHGPYVVVTVGDPDGPAPDPGQFYMLAAAERWGGGEDERPYLPRALSFLRAAGGALSFMLEDVGPGTARLCELRAGDELWLMGPLGIGFAPPRSARGGGAGALLAGGGVGIPPLAAWAATLAEQGTAGVQALLGFRDAHHAEGAKLLDAAPVRVATDDGSVGHHGFVTDLLADALDADPAATVYACGPPAMLEAVRALCAPRGVHAQLALEAGMACGFGACYGCAVPVREGGYLRLCVDGPVLDAARLDAVPLHA